MPSRNHLFREITRKQIGVMEVRRFLEENFAFSASLLGSYFLSQLFIQLLLKHELVMLDNIKTITSRIEVV